MSPRSATSPEFARMRTVAFAASSFAEIDVGVSIYTDGWRAVHAPSETVARLEIERRRELSRWEYNDRNIGKAWATRRPVLATHAGFWDLFVPVVVGGRVEGVIVGGPFARARPTSAEIIQRWHDISNEHASLADPTFHRYLAATLATLTLAPPELAAFEALLKCFARLLGGNGSPEALGHTWDEQSRKVRSARAAEDLWEIARSMVDERSASQWRTTIVIDPLRRLGMPRGPLHALVGLARDLSGSADAIGEALRRDALQRAIAVFALDRGGLAAGRVGDQGVVILAGGPKVHDRARAALRDLAAHAARIARRFDFRLHAGIALGTHSQSLADRYRAALGAADESLVRGAPAVIEQRDPAPSTGGLAHLRAKLAPGIQERPELLPARFQQYVDAVVNQTSYQHDATRAQLQVGLERFAEPWLATGQLDAKTFEELCASIETVPRGVGTTPELLAAYRRAVTEVARTIASPTPARQARSVDRALQFLRDHLADRITLAQVAKIARFVPSHFARLLKREQGTTFGRYLADLRLARAKHLLTTTSLPVARVAEQSGHRSRPYFQQIFRMRTGETPIAYRRRTGR